MRLYPKKLRNLDSLEQERKMLLRQKHELDKEEFFSFGNLLGKDKKDGQNTEGARGAMGPIVDILSGSSPIVDMLINIVQSRFTQKEKTQPDNYRGRSAKKKDRSVLNVIAREFIGGYLKWKAIELSYKGIKLIIKTRRDKKHGEE